MDFDEQLKGLSERIQRLADKNRVPADENQTIDVLTAAVMGAIARLVRIAEGGTN